MDAYLGFAKRGFQRAITYQFQFWSELVINLLFMYIYVCLWRALYTGRGAVAGYGRGQLLTYIVVSQTLITFQFTVGAWRIIETKVRSGEVAIDLVLVPYPGQPMVDLSEVFRSQARDGASHFHAYATA